VIVRVGWSAPVEPHILQTVARMRFVETD